MRKKSIYVWSLLVAMLTMTACSSDQNEDVDQTTRTGTFEFSIDFGAVDADNAGAMTRVSTAKPGTDWSNIKQLQFFLYDVSGNIAWSDITIPANGTIDGDKRKYTYATIPVGTYTLAVVANAQSGTDAVTTYVNDAEKVWSVANVHNWDVAKLDIRHKSGDWGAAINGSQAAKTEVSLLTPYTVPSEVFMGYKTGIEIKKGLSASAEIELTREVSLMRVRIDKTTNSSAVGKVNFDNAKASVMLYNLPKKMGMKEGVSGGVVNASTRTDALVSEGTYSTGGTGYLEAPYTYYKDVIVFPNNGGRANNAQTGAEATEKYTIVVCGIAEAGHEYSGGAIANAGDPVFWSGEIKEVFTPNVIREVNVLLVTGGSLTPPPGPIDTGGLVITVNKPAPWGPIVSSGPIEM